MVKPSLTNSERTKALGDYGEVVARNLLIAAGFTAVRNLNDPDPHHPFADCYAERGGRKFVISVRTRNKYLKNGTLKNGEPKLNPSYNFRKKSADPLPIAKQYNAEPAWIAIQVDAEKQSYSAYFGTMASLNAKGERYSVPMMPRDTDGYECLARDQIDPQIKPEWTNRMPMFCYKPISSHNLRRRLLDIAIEDDIYKSVLDALGAGIRKATERIASNEAEGAVIEYETKFIEGLLGAAFVVCEVQINGVISAALNINEQKPASKKELRSLGDRFDEKHSKVEVLWQLANYFKHRDEWSSKEWVKSRDTITAIKAAGLTNGSTGNLRRGAEALGCSPPFEMSNFQKIVEIWSEDVRDKCNKKISMARRTSR